MTTSNPLIQSDPISYISTYPAQTMNLNVSKLSSARSTRQSTPTLSFSLTCFIFLFAVFSDIQPAQAFSFQLPQIRMPWDNNSAGASTSSYPFAASKGAAPKSPIQPNDKVVVFGATGGIGQLVTKKLSNARSDKNYKLTVVAREASRARELLEDNESGGKLNVVELNLVGEDKASDEELMEAMSGATGIVISVGTTAFPTKRWSGGNTPQAIDQEAVSRIAKLASSMNQNNFSFRRMVLLTSVGVERTKEMPFLFLNLCGVLDAKRAGEDAVKAAAAEGNFSYSIVRPGRLVGGPYTNLDLANLFQIEGGAENGVTVAPGDDLLGDCKRDACAEAVVQCLENEACVDLEFSIVSNEETALTVEEWAEVFGRMKR
mmetsp:Transcript_29747/g.63153  ORF Transcript_29747/g.63153 Transcript_29747/m.63153 type:complete len:375 (-) Transcript_29747:102-1226(-)